MLSGQYAYSNGLESITQATNAFNAGLAGLAPQNGDNPNAPSAYLNYILFNSSYARVAAGAVQVPQAAGFEEPQRGSGYTNNNLLKFDRAISVSQTGYLYIWVSNESENTEVWFDDLNVIHQKTLVAEATDYGVWGDVMREQKWEDLEGKYRYGYQGKYAEKDDETGWSHFELREYDPVTGRWTSKDPKGQYFSPYVGMGNNTVSGVDPDGGKRVYYDANGNHQKTTHDNWFHNLLFGIDHYVPNGDGGHKFISKDDFWNVFQAGISPDKLSMVNHLIKIDLEAAVTHLNEHAHAKSIHRCGEYVGNALIAGGLKGGRADGKDYGPILLKNEFQVISDLTKYKPLLGDVTVYDGNSSHKWGHVQMYNGKQWVSDFFQGWIGIKPGYEYGGSGFKVYQKDMPPTTIYRYHR